MRRTLPLALGFFFCAASAAGPAGAQSSAYSSARDEVRAIADAYVEAAVLRSPGVETALGAARSPDRWADHAPAARAAADAREDALLARLAATDERAVYGTPEWLVRGALLEALESGRGRRVCRFPLWGGVDQIFGWHLEAAAAVGTQHAGTPEHRARALARWRDLPRFVDVEIANLREGLRLGYTAPRENVLRVIEQVEGALPADPAASPFHRLAERDSAPEFRAAWTEVVTGDVYPAMRRYLEFLRAEYLPAARVEPGLAALPDGLACYRAVVRGYTSVDVTPEEMRDAARGARAAMEAELAPIVRALTGEADAAEARRRLRTDPAWAYGSREAKLALTRAQVEALRVQVPRAFSRVPETPLVVEPAPAFRERSSPPAWYDPAPLDGSRPGTYWTNLHDAERAPRMDLASSTTHEGWPGHHLQIAWIRERPVPHPVMRLLSTGAYVEGWGMYAERLAFEEGMFDDPLMDAGVLSHLADALLGLEVDPGIHAFGWTREQAVDSMMTVAGRPRPSAESYADRHAATPGQIVTYMVGYLEIVRLRDEARRALGDRFDLRAFHDVVLDEGPMPLGMLRARVERWVEARSAEAAGAV